MEKWSQVLGFDRYEVSNLGKVRNIKTGRVLKGRDNGKNYLMVCLYSEVGNSNLKIHRLVAFHFIPNPENLQTINHINGNKLDNRVENLEWNSSIENNCHKYKGKNVTSKYTGVHLNKNYKKWISQINIEGKSKHLGSFDNEVDAHNARVSYEKSNGIINKYL